MRPLPLDIPHLLAFFLTLLSISLNLPPQFNQFVVSCRSDERHGGVEGSPVGTPLMALQNELANGICSSKYISVSAASAAAAPHSPRNPSGALSKP